MREEYIGNIKVIQSEYALRRSCSDDAETTEILRILQEEPPEEYSELIGKKKSWPYLLHLSHVRANVVRSLRFSTSERILEIGAGCGTITGFLAGRCREVTGVETSLLRCRINAERNKKYENILLLSMTEEEAETILPKEFDTVIWIDAQPDETADEGWRLPPKEKLAFCFAHLKNGGRLILGVDNRTGLRFFAGEKEEYTGHFFSGIEGYSEEKHPYSCTKKEWEMLLANMHAEKIRFYYPYPDHRFPMMIYTDDWLPGAEELHNNRRNFSNLKLGLFEEDDVWRTIVENDLFPQFSNSFLITAQKGDF